ncbi:MAG: single-stranded DNA-binding protein [Campylobacter sp.]|uniref:single-stranded DNA-binding protein n=1 Tax=Campylobacter sp. TaxID=205 RepID=UPI002A91BCBE|nr:single-stranded DNA-binding protein [Campylobacter sp.]MDY6188737.1 single-stranded DNA-binding protein [Campylobacter sp.]
MNLFIFNGTICRDIELKYTQNQGMAVISNSLAFNKKDANGNQSTVFLDFVAFGKTAELINQYYQKGDMLCGQGEIAQDEWEDKNTGAKRTKHKIIIQKLEFTKSPKAWASGVNGANNGANSNVSYNQAPQAPQSYNEAPQAPQSYGNYDHMPDTVTNAVERHNAEWQAQNTAQNLAQELDEIPF